MSHNSIELLIYCSLHSKRYQSNYCTRVQQFRNDSTHKKGKMKGKEETISYLPHPLYFSFYSCSNFLNDLLRKHLLPKVLLITPKNCQFQYKQTRRATWLNMNRAFQLTLQQNFFFFFSYSNYCHWFTFMLSLIIIVACLSLITCITD